MKLNAKFGVTKMRSKWKEKMKNKFEINTRVKQFAHALRDWHFAIRTSLISHF